MSYERQYKGLKKIVKRMLLELGLESEVDVSRMAVTILEDLYNQHYSEREISNAIVVVLGFTS